MPSHKVSILTKQEISIAAKNFQWSRRLPKWTVAIDGRQLPARPLVLLAAGVPPNDPTNSHQAVALLQDRGFHVYYEGKAVPVENENSAPEPVTDEFIDNLRGSLKGDGPSMIEMRERDHRIEKDRFAR